MQKTIRIMAIVATALMGVSLALVLASVLFQKPYGTLMQYPAEIIGSMPQFPVMQFLSCLFRLLCVAVLIACCGNKRGGIWLEVVVFACLAVLFPIVSQFTTPMYTSLISRLGGQYTMIAHSVANTLTTYALLPAGLGQAIAYLTCGMSIAFKLMDKETEKHPRETEEIPA